MYFSVNTSYKFLDDVSEDVLPNEATGFKESKIWNLLYNFQKDAVLQMFYSSVTNRRICLVDEKAKGIYKILDILLKSCTEGLHIQFFREKLGVKVNSESQLFEEVSNLCREDKKEITYLQIDMLLRCCLECLNTGNVRLHATDYTKIWELLEVLLVEYNYHMQRERYI